ncbi:MAG TPA: Wzz/FepE/Etk N-terminal domain-containing protein [Chitinophagaceae bacterium]|nr:Wzz/FepE/Etk N-terminal domain-containing protein [Chitinophagaceae bacterium]
MEHSTNNQRPGMGFNWKLYLSKLRKNIFWMLLSLVVFLVAAAAYVRYTTPLYQVVAFVEVRPPQNAASMLGGSPFTNASSVNAGMFQDMNSEIFKLQSAKLFGEVVDSLQLTIETTKNGRIKDQPAAADDMPFTIIVGKGPGARVPVYQFALGYDKFTVENERKKITAKYNTPVIIKQDTLLLSLKDKATLANNSSWTCRVLSREQAINKYKGRLLVSPVPKGGTGMLQVAMRDEIPARARQILEVLIAKYDAANFLFKNIGLRSEIAFLDSRLAAVNAELEGQENYVKNFKANNKINDVSTSANELLGNLTRLDTKKGDNSYKEHLLQLVEENISENTGNEERINVPGLQDVDLINLVGKYNDLVLQKKELLDKAAPMDIRLPPIKTKLEDTRRNIVQRIASIRKELATSNSFLEGQERSTTGRFVTLPAKEKDYIEVNRLLNIKQSLYIFLLQRKEDKNIEFASSGMKGSRIVDWHANDMQQPKPLLIYAGGLLVGLLLPAIVIGLRLATNKRVQTSTQISGATSIPMIGEIAFVAKKAAELVVTPANVTPVVEQFRTLRTNISYMNNGKENKVMLVTSGISGEGKSFISLNLANAFAIGKKKTVLLEFDLHSPCLSDYLQVTNTRGITDYLTSDCAAEEVVQPIPDCPDLYFISAGSSLPANPGEMILHNRMSSLFNYLRSHFEIVILDTPPLEAVSDALTISRWADSLLFVLRHKLSFLSVLTRLNQLYNDKKIPSPALIVNGIKPGEGFDNANGYGYGYSYKHRKKNKNGINKLKIA